MAVIGVPADAGAVSPTIPIAHIVAPIPTVGPLFYSAARRRHNCSASIVRSASRDLVLTAAHCITGRGAGIQFVPGYNRGRVPYGVWTAVQVYVDPSWKSRQDPRHDVVILKMGRQKRGTHSVGIQDVVGGNYLGVAPPSGTQVQVPAYPAGINDSPISCVNSIYRTAGYPGFDCHRYVSGTSGAPFLRSIGPDHRQVVVGVIGGLHQGGCLESTSYSAPFGSDTLRVLRRAALGSTPDVLPRPGSGGC